MQTTAQVHININSIPEFSAFMLARETLTAMRRVQREDPELWAKIKRRAAEIRKEGLYGGKENARPVAAEPSAKLEETSSVSCADSFPRGEA